MKYFLDTEFLEGTQKTFFGETKPTIDLISIGIVAEDGREYYAISKEFNLKEAWDRFEWKQKKVDDGIPGAYKEYWLRDNVLKPIEMDLFKLHCKANVGHKHIEGKGDYKAFKWMLETYGKTNKEIAEEVERFCTVGSAMDDLGVEGSYYTFKTFNEKVEKTAKEAGCTRIFLEKLEFYGYYSDYDWVVFCWLFGNMIDLPDSFPYYCIDLKQILDEKIVDYNEVINGKNLSEYTLEGKLDIIKHFHPNYPKQIDEHNALADARWNYELYKFLINAK